MGLAFSPLVFVGFVRGASPLAGMSRAVGAVAQVGLCRAVGAVSVERLYIIEEDDPGCIDI